MITKRPVHNVLLSSSWREKARDNDHFRQLILDYMGRAYPDYQVLKLKKGNESYIAVCERK